MRSQKSPKLSEILHKHNPNHYLSEDEFVYQNFIWLPLSDKSGLGKVSRVIWATKRKELKKKGDQEKTKSYKLDNFGFKIKPTSS